MSLIADSLSCFGSTTKEAALFNVLGLAKEANFLLNLPGGQFASKWSNGNKCVYSVICRRDKPCLKGIERVFSGKILVFSHLINTNHILQPVSVMSTYDVQTHFGIELSQQEHHYLKQTLFGLPLRRRLFTDHELVHVLVHIVQDTDDDDDDNHRPRRRRRMCPKWQDVLKESTLAQTGEAMCITCCDKAASVCFVPCGHQIMCDDCVKTMWEASDIEKKCPVCTRVPRSIVRPVTSQVRD